MAGRWQYVAIERHRLRLRIYLDNFLMTSDPMFVLTVTLSIHKYSQSYIIRSFNINAVIMNFDSEKKKIDFFLQKKYNCFHINGFSRSISDQRH